MKINSLKKQKDKYINHTFGNGQSFKGYRCKSDITIYASMFTYNYAYSPFKLIAAFLLL